MYMYDPPRERYFDEDRFEIIATRQIRQHEEAGPSLHATKLLLN